jgi:hypothetical protein
MLSLHNLQVIKKNRDPRWTDGRFEYMCEKPPIDDKVRIEVWSKGSNISMHPKVKCYFSNTSPYTFL